MHLAVACKAYLFTITHHRVACPTQLNNAWKKTDSLVSLLVCQNKYRKKNGNVLKITAPMIPALFRCIFVFRFHDHVINVSSYVFKCSKSIQSKQEKYCDKTNRFWIYKQTRHRNWILNRHYCLKRWLK